MISQFQIGRMRNFTYLITFDGESIVIDPQRDLALVKRELAARGSRLSGIILTHTHWDHTEGVIPILNEFKDPAPVVYVHKSDAHRLTEMKDVTPHFVKDCDQIKVGSKLIEVLHTPGHSAGECCFLLEAPSEIAIYREAAPRQNPGPHLFTGDTVFVGNVGRTDLESGSTAEMFATLQRLKKLPPQTMIYPGHDYGTTPVTTIGRECQESAAFRCRTVEELDAVP